MIEDVRGFWRAEGSWYRGNVHAHSTRSDGRLSPEAVVAWYRERGYDFLSLTDHRTVTPVESAGDFLCIPGVELNTPPVREGKAGLFHILGLGIGPECRCDVTESPQEIINAIREAGGLAVIAHPMWSGNAVDEEFLGLDGYIGIECFNFGCEVENHTGLGVGYWRMLLRHRPSLLGFAADDSHRYTDDSGGGWIMVKARELTQGAILAAIEAGHFYSSSGPVIHDVSVADGAVTVKCSPAEAVHFMTGTPGSSGLSVRRKNGELPIQEARYEVRKRDRYVRVEVYDSRHRAAWTNPLFVNA